MKHLLLVPWFGTAFFFLAVTSALYYHGFIADFFCITQVLLLLWLLSALWHQDRKDIPLPRSALALFLAAYAGWLALTIAWGTVPNYNIITFWELSSLPLVFWLYTISPERAVLWRRVGRLILFLALTLSAQATYQLVMGGLEPKSVFLDLNSHAAFIALIALPTAGAFLARLAARAGCDRTTFVLGGAVFVLVFAVSLTAGRGAMLVLVVGIGVLIGVAWRRLPGAGLGSFAVLIMAGLVAGNVVAHGRTTMRMVTLIDPTTAGWGRFVIWERTWRIITESPWLGKGLGVFGLVFPQYQNPLEGSAGFMAHNDYLQLWLEAGLPAVILLLAIYVSAFVLFVRVLNNRRINAARTIEITGLFCGLLVVALHSFVNFNLYVLPTLLVAGLMLARFHELATAGPEAHVWVFKPARYLRLSIYRSLLLLVVIAGTGYWISQALANYAFQEAVQLVKEGELDRADTALTRAHRLSPDSEMVLVARAELYRHVIVAASSSATEEKERLFASAIETLDRAGELNPYRADISFLRARLLWLVKTAAGDNWKQQTVRGYEQSIRLQPRFYTARAELASFWLEQNEVAKARAVLEQGMAYEYLSQERVLPYYRLTAVLRRQAGEIEGAQQLEQRIADILSVPPEKRILPLDQVRFFSFYDLWRRFLGLFGRA